MKAHAPKLELVGVSKAYDGATELAVDRIDLAIEAGETLALLGPSGCGKSSTLNMIVGLERPSAGDIRIDGQSIVKVPPGQRNVGLVFQDYAVFTHMTVAQNLAFGLAVRGVPRRQIETAVAKVAELLGLGDALKARARDLGGSELQRVAIGRTLVTEPAILLLDEPLSNLEPAARLAMRRELRRLQAETGLTIVYVTHDQIEAISLADRIAVMSQGRLRQVASTALIYEQPEHVFVAGFMGSPAMNLLPGRVTDRDGRAVFSSAGFELSFDAAVPLGARDDVVLGVRPELLKLVPQHEATWAGTVAAIEPRGPEAVVTLQAEQIVVKAIVGSGQPVETGRMAGVHIDAADCLFFDRVSGQRLVLH